MYRKFLFVMVLFSVLLCVAPALSVGGSASSSTVELQNPLGDGKTDISVILGGIIKYAMGILGSLTLLVFVYGGFLWLISAGNPENVKKGMQTMLWAVIGIFIIFASYGILTLVFNAIGAKKDANDPLASGSGISGGPTTQAEVVKQTEQWQCVPQKADGKKDSSGSDLEFDLEKECGNETDLANCMILNTDIYQDVVCEFTAGKCIKEQGMTEEIFCAKLLDKDSCVNKVSSACEVVE